MSVVKIILWAGLIIAVIFDVLVILIKLYRMEKIIALLEDQKSVEILSANEITVEDAVERVKQHRKTFQRLNYTEDGQPKKTDKKGKPIESKWDFEGITDPERIANKVVALIISDRRTERKRSLFRKLDFIPDKKEDEVLTQMEALIEIALDTEGTLEEAVDVEQIKLERDIDKYASMLRESQERLRKKEEAKQKK